MLAALTFRLDSKVRGYHVYQAIWTNPCIGDELICEQEIGNSHDPQAVAMKKEIDCVISIVGHVPREISSICSSFIRQDGAIRCLITESRQSTTRWS